MKVLVVDHFIHTHNNGLPFVGGQVLIFLSAYHIMLLNFHYLKDKTMEYKQWYVKQWYVNFPIVV